jgi:hypothetical protein
VTGDLHRLAVRFVADQGSDLEVTGTVLVAREWTGPTVLGYYGLLDRVRLAIDPGVTFGEQWIFFGKS